MKPRDSKIICTTFTHSSIHTLTEVRLPFNLTTTSRHRWMNNGCYRLLVTNPPTPKAAAASLYFLLESLCQVENLHLCLHSCLLQHHRSNSLTLSLTSSSLDLMSYVPISYHNRTRKPRVLLRLAAIQMFVQPHIFSRQLVLCVIRQYVR